MNFVFLMDPLETVNVHKDTSFIFMVGAVRRGHRVFYLPSGGLSIDRGRVVFDALEVTPHADLGSSPGGPFERGMWRELTDDDVDAVFIRTDPPFDATYLMNTWLLDHLPRRVVTVNEASSVRTVNEKVWAVRFTELMPPTVVTRHRRRFDAFRREHGKVVAKPTDGKGGEGVFIIEPGDKNAAVVFETLTHNGRREVLVQQYVPEAEAGDKRILLLNGQFLGAVLRVHGSEDHRNNFFAGGKPYPAELTARDERIIETLRPHLRKLGLHFVGIDVLGDYLIEVNVTSPTCLQEANRFADPPLHLEDKVVDYVEQLVEQRRESIDRPVTGASR